MLDTMASEYFEDADDQILKNINTFLLNKYLDTKNHTPNTVNIFKLIMNNVYDSEVMVNCFQEKIEMKEKNLNYIYMQPYITENFLNLNKNSFWI